MIHFDFVIHGVSRYKPKVLWCSYLGCGSQVRPLPRNAKQKPACPVFLNPQHPPKKGSWDPVKCASNYQAKDYKRRGRGTSAWFISLPRIHSLRKTLCLPMAGGNSQRSVPRHNEPSPTAGTDTTVAGVSHTGKTFCCRWAEWMRVDVCISFMSDFKTKLP